MFPPLLCLVLLFGLLLRFPLGVFPPPVLALEERLSLREQDAAFTLDVYAHATNSMKRESANRMGQYIHSVTKT